MDPIVFEPKGSIGLPFLVLLAIVVLAGGYGLLRSMKGGGGIAWILGVVVLIALGAGYWVLQARHRAEAITVYADRIATSSWAIPYSQIRDVREEYVSVTQYSGGRPVTSTQRQLVVDTDEGPKGIAYEATFEVDAMKAALIAAWEKYNGK